MLATLKDEMEGTMSFAGLTDAIAVAMEQWSTQCAFITETSFKNGDSVVKTQRTFHKHFNTAHHKEVPCCNSI
jgi:hypothetical protein